MAISLLQNDFECPYTFTKNYTQFCCDKCYNNFKEIDFSKDPNVCQKHKNLINFAPKQRARAKSLIKNVKDADPIKISAIKEELRLKLTSIASKLLSSEDFHFSQLSEEEQHLWQQFDKEEIYQFITGEEDTLPEFQYNWIEPCQLAVHLPPELQNILRDLLPQAQAPQPPAPIQPPPAPAAGPAQQIAQPAPIAPPPQPQPVPGPSGSQAQATSNQHQLRPKKSIDYKELHTGVKTRCRRLRRQAKAVVTKLAPGAFSPKNKPPDSPSNQGQSS